MITLLGGFVSTSGYYLVLSVEDNIQVIHLNGYIRLSSMGIWLL